MIQQHFRINEVSGVNILINADGTLDISYCVVKASGNQVDIVKKASGLKTIADLNKSLSSKTPVALNLVGKGILVKETEFTEGINTENFSKILPNANFAEFHLQEFISGKRCFISMIRQTEAEKWLKQFSNAGIEILSLSLGPFVIFQVLPQLNFYGEEILFGGHRIIRNQESEWLSYQYSQGITSPYPVKLEVEQIVESLLLPYAAAFQLILVRSLNPVIALVPEIENRLKASLADKKIVAVSFMILAGLFLMLLINFLMFTHYSAANDKLAKRVGQTSKNVNDVDMLNKQIGTKKALLDTLGWEEGIKQSILIDRIAQLLPPDVIWEEVNINPALLNEQSEQQNLHFLKRKIKVTGSSSKIVQVNEWISRVKSLGWVKKVQMVAYSYSNELNTGQFTVLIDY